MVASSLDVPAAGTTKEVTYTIGQDMASAVYFVEVITYCKGEWLL